MPADELPLRGMTLPSTATVAQEVVFNSLTSETLDELIEWTLRAVQSFMSNPSDPPREPDELRGYLRRWLAPAIRQWVDSPATETVG
jgi:hypothetical protein